MTRSACLRFPPIPRAGRLSNALSTAGLSTTVTSASLPTAGVVVRLLTEHVPGSPQPRGMASLRFRNEGRAPSRGTFTAGLPSPPAGDDSIKDERRHRREAQRRRHADCERHRRPERSAAAEHRRRDGGVRQRDERHVQNPAAADPAPPAGPSLPSAAIPANPAEPISSQAQHQPTRAFSAAAARATIRLRPARGGWSLLLCAPLTVAALLPRPTASRVPAASGDQRRRGAARHGARHVPRGRFGVRGRHPSAAVVNLLVVAGGGRAGVKSVTAHAPHDLAAVTSATSYAADDSVVVRRQYSSSRQQGRTPATTTMMMLGAEVAVTGTTRARLLHLLLLSSCCRRPPQQRRY